MQQKSSADPMYTTAGRPMCSNAACPISYTLYRADVPRCRSCAAPAVRVYQQLAFADGTQLPLPVVEQCS